MTSDEFVGQAFTFAKESGWQLITVSDPRFEEYRSVLPPFKGNTVLLSARAFEGKPFSFAFSFVRFGHLSEAEITALVRSTHREDEIATPEWTVGGFFAAPFFNGARELQHESCYPTRHLDELETDRRSVVDALASYLIEMVTDGAS